MIEINAKVLESKALTLSKKNFGNKMDNCVTKVIFTDICEVGDLLNKYVAFLSPADEIFLFPLNQEDNSFLVTTSITQLAGTWRMLYLATNTEISEEGEIDTNYKVFVSNSIDFTITENYLSDILEEVIVDENLKIIYEELEQQILYLSSEEFKNELISQLRISEEDIQTITNNLKNDEEFKAEIKGEDGEPGKSAYQTWLDLGNTGTEEDFINSLKGKDGESCYHTGEEAPTDTSKLWIVEEEDSNEEIVLSTTINKIEVVNEYPETRDPKTLYILVEE